MSLIAATTSQGLSVISSNALQASHPNPAPNFTTSLTPPSRIPSSCIGWSHDTLVVFVASGGSVSAYDAVSGAWIRDIVREGEGGIGGAKLGCMAVLDADDGSGPTLAFSRGSRAVVFNTETRRPILTIEGHKSAIFAMSAACDQSLLATSSAEMTMITNFGQQSTTVLRGAPPGATAAAFHPSRRTTLLILSPKGLHVFDTTKGGAPIRTIPISKAESTGGHIAFSPCTPALVAIAVPGAGGRIVLLDIDKDSSLLKKLDAQESITALAFSHDGGALVAGTETGHVLQVNIRSTDASGQPIAVDPTGGKIGGLALVAESPAEPKASSKPMSQVTRTESMTSSSTGSLRIKSSMSDLRGTLRTRPSMLDLGSKSPESPRLASPETLRNKSPQILRTKSSAMDLNKKSSVTDLRSKTSPGALRIKAGVENKVRPTSMITATAGKERVRVRPISMTGEEVVSESEVKPKARDTISRAAKLSLVGLKPGSGTPSPVSRAGSSPLRDRVEKESTISPASRRRTQTMPRRLTSEGSRPSLTQIFVRDDARTSSVRSRSSSHSTAPLASVVDQISTSNAGQGSTTPQVSRPTALSTTPIFSPGPAVQVDSPIAEHEPEEKILVPRTGERERPWSRLGEERARSRLGNETPRLPTIEDRPRSRIGGTERPRSRAFEDRQLGSESERERPASRIFRDDVDRPASRVGTLGSAGSATLGLGRPTGLARRFSTDLKPTPEMLRVVSESGLTRERVDSLGSRISALQERGDSLRERPEPVLRKRSSIIFRDQADSIFRERPDSTPSDRPESVLRNRSSTPLSASSTRISGKRVGWVDKESPYVSAPLDTIYTPARPRSGATGSSMSGSVSSDEESDCARRGTNALLVTPRRGLAAALGAEVYAGAGDAPSSKSSTSLTRAQAQDLLRNIVSDVMFEFRQEAKEDVRGLHLDLLRASRGWKHDLKEYLGDTLEELRLVKEENAQLRAEIARLRRGY